MTTYTQKKWKKILKFAKANGVAAACEKFDVGRTTVYEKKKRFKVSGSAGLEPIQRTPGHHPSSTPDDVVEMIEALALKRSQWSAEKIVDSLRKKNGSRIPTSVTVRKIIKKCRLENTARKIKILRKSMGLECPILRSAGAASAPPPQPR